MPQLASPWVWRRALRDQGPRNASLLLTLYTIGTFMNREGVAFPSQQQIAYGARASVRTVQRHLREAVQLGWIIVVSAGRNGQGWRMNAYRAALPDGARLDDVDQKIVDAFEEAGDIAVSPALCTSLGITAPPTTVEREGDDTQSTETKKVTTSAAEGDDTQSTKVTTQLCRTNSRQKLSLLELTLPEEARVPRVPDGLHMDERQKKDPERIRKARKHLEADPTADVMRIYRLSDADIHELQRANT